MDFVKAYNAGMNPTDLYRIPFGISAMFWLLVGTLRTITELFGNKSTGRRTKLRVNDVAAIIPAHNEEMAIRSCIKAIGQSLPRWQIYVASDGSNDKTYNRARREKCHVSRLIPGRGKAKAITYLIQRHKLYDRYKLIFIIDSDTRIDKNFVMRALPLFNDPEIGVVFGTARISWPKHIWPQLKYYFVAYRERLNRLLQYTFVHGQTWKYTNVSYVVPGFATIWRSSILKQVSIDTPGLLIEDFNTAFQIQKKKLCKVGFRGDLIGWDQHPENLSDYWKQVRRWNIGFFQTVKKNGIWPSFFWLSLGVFMVEVSLHAIFILLLPFLIVYLLLPMLPEGLPFSESYMSVYRFIGPYRYVTLRDLILTFVIIDYGLSVLIGVTHKKPQFIFYGIFFIFMHYVTSLILLSSLAPGFLGKSKGQWVSPARSLSQLSVKI